MDVCIKCYKGNLDVVILSQCGHNFCYQCLCQYLQNFTSSTIVCPVEDCKEIIEKDIVKKCLSNFQLEIFNSLCSDSNSVNCFVNNCHYSASSENIGEKFICPFCEQPNCLVCGRLHDFKEECESIKDYNLNEIEARANEVLMKGKRSKLQKLNAEYYLLPNPESFECSVCDIFVLPRAGVILRNCLHCFCLDCLRESLKTIVYINQITCLMDKCKKVLDSSEILELINEERYSKMIIQEAAFRFYQCKNGDCCGMWDITTEKGSYECPECSQMNCIECQDIHDGIDCEEFRKESRYVSPQDRHQILNENEHIKCFVCTKILIKKGGCSAMHCSNCGTYTCIYTGKRAGRHDIQKCYCSGISNCSNINMFCECTSLEPCDINCMYGCHPDKES